MKAAPEVEDTLLYEIMPRDTISAIPDNGKGNGNYYSILVLYRDNGKENGNDYNVLG